MDTAKIYEDFSKPLKSYIQKRVNDPALAEDLLHDVFLKIHSQIGSVKDANKLSSWIYRIAQNSIIDSYRRRKQTVPPEDELPSADSSHLNDAAERLSPILKRMAEQLPDKYREAILLADFGSVKQTELSKRWRISISAVKSRVQRARKLLKELLLQCCHFEFDRYGTIFDYYPKDCRHCCGKIESHKC